MNPNGRPPSEHPRTTRKSLCLTEEENAAQFAAAKAAGMTWTAWLCRAADMVATIEANERRERDRNSDTETPAPARKR